MSIKGMLPTPEGNKERPWSKTEKWLRLILFIVITAVLAFIFSHQNEPVSPLMAAIFFIALTIAFVISWRKGYFPF